MAAWNEEALWPLHLSRMITQIEDDIKTLNDLWKEMGFSKERMEDRMDLVEMHCLYMFRTMVKEEKECKSRLKVEVKQFTDEVNHLANELKEDITLDFQFESLLSAEYVLKVHLERLKKIKEDRQRKYWTLNEKDKCISLRLGIEQYPESEGSVPTAEYLKSLTKELATKESDLERLEKIYLEKRKVILSLMEEMEIKPSTALEKNIASDDISSISLTKEFLNSVQKRAKELLLDQEAKLGTQVSGNKRNCLPTRRCIASSKMLCSAPQNDKKKTASKMKKAPLCSAELKQPR